MDNPITVLIPVGPWPWSTRWLPECLQSVLAQTRQADEILLVDDMAGLDERAFGLDERTFCRIWRAPWRLGVAGAFNAGVAMAAHDLIIMLGADDRLMPQALELCEKAYQIRRRDALGYYHMDVEYSDGEQQNLPCHAAMVTKALWRHTGGFPPESGIGAPDAAFISVMLAHYGGAGHLYRVESPEPLYWVRRHRYQDTAMRQVYQRSILEVRDILTSTWQRPKWGRFVP